MESIMIFLLERIPADIQSQSVHDAVGTAI